MSVRVTCALALLFVSTCLTAAAQQTHPYHCAVWVDKDVYFSDEFAIPRFAQTSALRKVKEDFVEFVKTKYSLHDITGGCSDDKSAEETNAKEQKRKIIETGWKYSQPIPVRTGP
jgi:hypothetical protein